MKTLFELIFNPAVVSFALLLLLLAVSLLVTKRVTARREHEKESAIPLSKEQTAQYAIERKRMSAVHKREQTVMQKYGVKNVSSLDWVKEKRKQTMLSKFSVPYAFLLCEKYRKGQAQ